MDGRARGCKDVEGDDDDTDEDEERIGRGGGDEVVREEREAFVGWPGTGLTEGVAVTVDDGDEDDDASRGGGIEAGLLD